MAVVYVAIVSAQSYTLHELWILDFSLGLQAERSRRTLKLDIAFGSRSSICAWSLGPKVRQRGILISALLLGREVWVFLAKLPRALRWREFGRTLGFKYKLCQLGVTPKLDGWLFRSHFGEATSLVSKVTEVMGSLWRQVILYVLLQRRGRHEFIKSLENLLHRKTQCLFVIKISSTLLLIQLL